MVDLTVELRRQDQMQARDTDQNTGDQLAEDGGQLKSHHQLRQGAGRDENEQEATNRDQGFGCFYLVVADLKQKGWKRHGVRRWP